MLQEEKPAACFLAPPEPEPTPVSHLEAEPTPAGLFEDAQTLFERWGLPELAWHTGASLSAALGLSSAAGDKLLRDVLVLSLRLPLTWERVLAGTPSSRPSTPATPAWTRPASTTPASPR